MDQRKIRRIIGLLPENVGLYDELSSYENLDFYGRLYKCSEQRRKERIEYFLKTLGLWEKRGQSAGTFSKGMKQKLAVARALIGAIDHVRMSAEFGCGLRNILFSTSSYE